MGLDIRSYLPGCQSGMHPELKKLRKYFLPRQFDLTGNYNERRIALATAYRVLAHAEIESYLEDRVLDLARSAAKMWKEKKKTTQVLVYLFAFSGLTLDKPPDSVTPDQPSKSKTLQEKLKFDEKRNNVSNSFEYLVIHNHGIKEKNLLSLLLPIGINSDDIDTIWLQEMDNFGQKRGEFAHQSASKYKTEQPPDPKNELEMVNRLVYGSSSEESSSKKEMKGLIHIDRLLNDLLN